MMRCVAAVRLPVVRGRGGVCPLIQVWLCSPSDSVDACQILQCLGRYFACQITCYSNLVTNDMVCMQHRSRGMLEDVEKHNCARMNLTYMVKLVK
jgi:hypothetical protein